MARATLIHDSNRKEKCEIFSYLHCQLCLESIPDGESPETWARLSVGMTPKGIQIWCVRHKCSVDHIKFTMEKAENLGPGIIYRKD